MDLGLGTMGSNTKVYIGIGVGAAVLFVAIMIGVSLRRLDTYEVGLQYDTVQRDLDKKAKTEGLYPGPPGYRFIKFPSVFQSLAFLQLPCLNKDGVTIYLNVSYQYRTRSNDLYEVITQFKDHETYARVLTLAGQSAIQVSCSMFNTSEFQSRRSIFQGDISQRLVSKYNTLKCDVAQVQVNNIVRPENYEKAVQSKESARENIGVAEQERPRALIEANTVLEQARTQATIITQTAESKARIVTNKAERDAQAIEYQYEQEAAVYQEILQSLNLTKEGLLAYLSVRTITSAPNDVYIGLKAPAKSSYVT